MNPPKERGHVFGGQPMRKSKAIRVAGFVGALGASAALVGFAATGTGAYFTDSHNGTIQTSTGSVKVNVSPGDGILTFANLLPGEDKTQTVSYTAAGTGAEDIWLVFPTNGDAEAFVGKSGDALGGGLGRYGHFKLNSPAGGFESYNLNGPADPNNPAQCSIDGNGHCGSNLQATTPTDTQVNYCAPANAILLQSGLTYGQSGSSDLTFGFTRLLRNQAQTPMNVSYKIVATQSGIRPDNA
ncbi:MAG: hypothetical protein JWN96_313, partial [Mycobacterium sp.]|nr:hypothetical protein [Mycobacterium sp.]